VSIFRKLHIKPDILEEPKIVEELDDEPLSSDFDPDDTEVEGDK
jgi:hypothetical protein